MLYEFYANRIPRDSREQVSKARERFHQKIRNRLSAELFNLQGKNETDAHEITIEIEQGRDGPLHTLLENQENRILPEYLKVYESDIRIMKASAGKLINVIHNIPHNVKNQSEPEAIEFLYHNLEHLEGVQQLAEYMLELASYDQIVESIFRVQEEDILGSYKSIGKNGRVTLYYEPIAIFADILGVSISSLTTVVLIHELAHGYTHLGKDKEDSDWDTSNFFSVENRGVAEGLAQYYTDIISETLGDREDVSIHYAYLRLRRKQAGLYRIHDKWVEQFSPEVVRDALVKFRRNNQKGLDEFVEKLLSEKEALKSSSRPLHPRVEEDIAQNGNLIDPLEDLLNWALVSVHTQQLKLLSPSQALCKLKPDWTNEGVGTSYNFEMSLTRLSLSFSNDFWKTTNNLDKKMKSRIFDAIAEISIDPITPKGDTIKPLKGENRFESISRYRIGDNRLLYYVDRLKSQIVVLEFGARGEIYD